MNLEQEEMSGFDGAFSDSPVTPVEPPVESAPVETEESPAVVEPEVASEPEVAAPEIDVRALADRISHLPDEIRRVHGKYGELHREIQSLQQNSRRINPDDIVADRFKRISVDYPDLAELLAEDLKGLFAGVSSDSPEEPKQPVDVEQIVLSRTEPLTKQIQVLQLSLEHADWKHVARSPEFQQWKSALPMDEQDRLDNSWDAAYLSEKLSAYKATIKPKEEVSPKASEKNKVIQAAVTPVGSKASAPATDSELDAFLRATGAK